MANDLGHVTYLDQSGSSKINNGHVTQQGKQNWPMEGCEILQSTFSPLWDHKMTSYI